MLATCVPWYLVTARAVAGRLLARLSRIQMRARPAHRYRHAPWDTASVNLVVHWHLVSLYTTQFERPATVAHACILTIHTQAIVRTCSSLCGAPCTCAYQSAVF